MISFISQKALYACVTCSVPNAPDFSPAGICLACSYACHNDHTLVELYTKRQFRCDCGNSKFPKSNRCRLRDDKDTINEKNEYNQNYRYILQFNLETFKSFHKIIKYPKPKYTLRKFDFMYYVRGVYCTCHRPYPDDEDPIPDAMIQVSSYKLLNRRNSCCYHSMFK